MPFGDVMIDIVERMQNRGRQAMALGLRVTGWVLTDNEFAALIDWKMAELGGEEAVCTATGHSIWCPWYWNGSPSGIPIVAIREWRGDHWYWRRRPELL